MVDLSRRSVLTRAVLVAAGLLFSRKAESRRIANAGHTIFPQTLTDLDDPSTRFGFELLREFGRQRHALSNLAVSPASLMAAFSLVDIGADAAFGAALRKTFRLGVGKEKDFAALRKLLAPVMFDGSSQGPISGVAAVYVDEATPLRPKALAAFKALGANIETRRLSDPAVPAEINAFVKKRTKGEIPKLIDGLLDDKGLVLINALYFKDAWKTPFEVRATSPAHFHLADGKTRSVPFMHGGEGLYLAAEEGAFAAVQLPYATAGYSLIVVVNTERSVRIEDFAPVAGWLAGSSLELQKANVALPRFAVRGGGDILSCLDALGLKPADQKPDALDGLSDVHLTIAAVPHKAAISVDEGGTTAAAATAVETMPTSAPPSAGKVLEIVADKPFMFALRDDNIGLTLMIGYVGDPTS